MKHGGAQQPNVDEILEGAQVSISVVLPVLNELDNLPDVVEHLIQLGIDQVIFVDGGSEDGSIEWLQENWLNDKENRVLLRGRAGRAQQMNDGARVANGEVIVFLHADTKLPRQAVEEINSAIFRGFTWGRFDVNFSDVLRGQWLMKLISSAMNLRSRMTKVATGDQAIFVQKELFESVGGFPEIKIMEDVAFSKSLKSFKPPFCSRKKVETSARRWQHQGIIKTVLLMWCLRAAYFVGVSPNRLAEYYSWAR